jgi:hypothetical protein
VFGKRVWVTTIEIGGENLLKKQFVFHPILFTFYAFLALLASNLGQISLEVLSLVLKVVAGAILLIILNQFIFKDKLQAGLVSSTAILLFFSYGHVLHVARTWKISAMILGQDAVLAPLWIILFGYSVYRIKKGVHLSLVSNYLNWVSLIVLVFPIFTLLRFSGQVSDVNDYFKDYQDQITVDQNEIILDPRLSEEGLKQLPDIYYIVLDAYTRADVLAELYDYDNTPFIDALEQRGFYIAQESVSNYTASEFSIASSLNMTHINTLPDYLVDRLGEANDLVLRDAAEYMLGENTSMRALKTAGYTTVSIDNRFERTNIKKVDEKLHSLGTDVSIVWKTGFEVMLYDSTFGRVFEKIGITMDDPNLELIKAHRENVLFAFANIPVYAEKEGNFFVFAHIISPHFPYVFGRNGEEVSGYPAYTLLNLVEGQEECIHLYRDQVHYLNSLILDTIDQILEDSDQLPIIILQADHSSRVYNELDPGDEIHFLLNAPILNAYLVPEDVQEALYPSITPVNSFRILFNNLFQTDLTLLEDITYHMDFFDPPFRFTRFCRNPISCH